MVEGVDEAVDFGVGGGDVTGEAFLLEGGGGGLFVQVEHALDNVIV